MRGFDPILSKLWIYEKMVQISFFPLLSLRPSQSLETMESIFEEVDRRKWMYTDSEMSLFLPREFTQ